MSPLRGLSFDALDKTKQKYKKSLTVSILGVMAGAVVTIVTSAHFLIKQWEVNRFIELFVGPLNEAFVGFWYFMLISPIFSGVIQLVVGSFAVMYARQSLETERRIDNQIESHMHSSCCKQYCGSASLGFFRASIFTILVLCVAQGGFAIGYIVTVHKVEAGISNTDLTPFESEATTLQLAVFNLCCFEEGWSAQGEILKCQPGEQLSCTLPDRYADYEDTLCVCYTSDKYPEYYSSLSSSTEMCTLLSDVVITITASTLVPGQDVPISAFVPVRSASIVGYNGAIGDNQGYGCGFGGYARAFQWMIFKYIADKTSRLAYTFLVIASLQVIGILMVMCLMYSASEDAEDYGYEWRVKSIKV